MEHTIKMKRSEPRRITGFVIALVVIALLAVVAIWWLSREAGPAAPPYWPTSGWRTSAPEAQGLDSSKTAELLLAIREHNVPVHSLLIVRNGYVVADATFYPYDGQTVHDVASVTKSVMTTLIGIAAAQGKLELDDAMVSFFPERTIANLDARKERITVRHLVTMSSGLACVRDGWAGNTNDEMQASTDFVQFALDLPVAWEPGEHFVYCSPAIHLLSPILEKATGMTALEFARQNLFEPLGIREAMWEQDPQGYYNGWGDLSLLPRDMAKIGFLFLHEGRWEGKQIVPRDWVREASQQQIIALDGSEDGYGYGWWMAPDTEGGYRADGRLGQYIYVLPAWNMVLVTTGGGFDIDDIAEPLLATFGDLETLPANPEGVARLEAATAAVAQAPEAEALAPLPEVTQAVSGQIYRFEPNAVGIETVALAFEDDAAEATAEVTTAAGAMQTWTIGLDGVYRFKPGGDGRALAMRGAWQDARTFVLEYNGVTTNDHMLMTLVFENDGVQMTLQEGPGAPGLTVRGQKVAP